MAGKCFVQTCAANDLKFLPLFCLCWSSLKMFPLYSKSMKGQQCSCTHSPLLFYDRDNNHPDMDCIPSSTPSQQWYFTRQSLVERKHSLIFGDFLNVMRLATCRPLLSSPPSPSVISSQLPHTLHGVWPPVPSSSWWDHSWTVPQFLLKLEVQKSICAVFFPGQQRLLTCLY